MNERIRELLVQCQHESIDGPEYPRWTDLEKFAELIVKEMCGLMEQTEDDVYHCYEPSEQPTEYVDWLRDWQGRFTEHFGVKE